MMVPRGDAAHWRTVVLSFRFVFCSLLAASLIGCSTAAAQSYGGAFSIVFENDALTGSDSNYTNGVGLSWTSNEIKAYDSDSAVRKWVNFWSFLPFVDADQYRTYASFTLGQEMHTPNDITDSDPPVDDQPYAGVLYLDNVITSRSGRWGHTWTLRLGIVGPSSGAETVQREIHDVIGSKEPAGWDTQLPDEPIVNVSYTAAYLLSEGDWGSANWRVVPIGNVSLGNYVTDLSAGLYTEVGWNLADAFAFSSLRNGFNTALTTGVGPQPGWSLSFFAGAGANAVAHYLPLDGTVFRDSRSVNTEPVIGFLSGGMSVRFNRFAASLSVTYFSETFATQRDDVSFGTLNFAWYY